MLQIDRISLRLPAGFAHRATRIARLVGEQLATEAAALPAGRAERFTVSVASPNPHVSDSEIARLAVAQLLRSLRVNP